MTSCYTRDQQAGGRFADEFSDMLTSAGQAPIISAAASFEASTYQSGDLPSEGQRLALKRAMARFLIDSGIASERGWLS